jgi:hypothetical protein
VPDIITVTLEDGSKYVYQGRMAEKSLMFLAATGFLDDLVDQAVAIQEQDCAG